MAMTIRAMTTFLSDAMTPFELDTGIKEIAAKQNLRVAGRLRITVDERRLPKHLFRMSPDYTRIRQLVAQGEEIPGVTVGNYEYVLQEQTNDTSEPV